MKRLGKAAAVSLLLVVPILAGLALFAGWLVPDPDAVASSASTLDTLPGWTFAALGATAAPALRSFREGTRRHFQPVQTFAISGWETAEQKVPAFTMDKTGFLSAIWVTIKGEVDFVVAAATLNVEGLAALFSSINVSTNLGSAAVIDASGPGVALASRGHMPGGPRGRVSALTAGVDRTFEYALRIPISANDGDMFGLGAINLQDPQVQMNVRLTLAALNTVFVPGGGGSLANAAATIQVTQEFWEVPDPSKFLMPPRSIVRTLEDFMNPIVVGENIYEVPRLGTMLQYHAAVVLNGVRATLDQITSLKLRLNKSVYIEELTPREIAAIAAYNYPALYGAGVVGAANVPSDVPSLLEPGALTRDYWHAMELMGAGDLRDALDTEEVTTTEYIVTIASGVAGTSFIRHVRRVAQML